MENYFKLKYMEEIIGYIIFLIIMGLPIIIVVVALIIEKITNLFKNNKGE